MRANRRKFLGRAAQGCLIAAGLLAGALAHAGQFNLSVVDGDGNPVSGFKWLLQEDTTYAMDPANPGAITDQLSTNFHKSYHPPARTQTTNANNPLFGQPLSGNEDSDSLTVTSVTPGRYYLTVFPYSDHAMGGAPVTVLSNADDPSGNLDDVTMVVEQYPLPTAQIAVYLFHDCFPLNGAPDLPEELATSDACPWAAPDFSQFSVIVEEPAGKYGIAGGQVIQDAFGNPLGTAYDADGNPVGGADGTLTPNADGTLTIQNLAPGKYGIIVTAPNGWTQTSTIEGSPVIDAWVKANEPPFMVEFGLPGPHVFLGFTQERNDLSGGMATVSGTITDMHMSRPPSTQFFSGRPFPQCWVAINEGGGAAGINRYAGPCDADSGFSIAGVPPGNYELKVFDDPLDVVIATLSFTVDPTGTCNGGQSCAFGEVPVFNWFNRLSTFLFNDDNQNGFWDPSETSLGAESGPVNIRWRDGTVYQSFPTDFEGAAPFDEVFPFFHWMVAEVGFTGKKATGATIVVDDGGEITSTGEFPDYGELNPQPQSENAGAPYRTETGPVLTQAFQGFLGQTSVIHFGKTDYVGLDFTTLPPIYVGENGGISGVVLNTVTRAENDPRLAVAEEWEAGVPRVQVTLYADGDVDAPFLNEPFNTACGQVGFPCGIGDIDWNGNGALDADDNEIDDLNGDGQVTLSDVDNHPLGWGDPNCANSPAIPGNECRRGPEDVDRDDLEHTLVTNAAAVFELGDALTVTWTDSWDDSTPTGCQGQNNQTGIADERCFDGMRNWNQVRPGVFDGGYAFTEYDLAHLQAVRPTGWTFTGGVDSSADQSPAAKIQGFYDHIDANVAPDVAANLSLGLLPADYIVEAASPPGFKALREHHKNVDFGDQYEPAMQALPPVCVGPDQPVPDLFAISTKDGSGDTDEIVPGITLADAAAPFAGEMRPVCDQKKVPLNSTQNAAADFFLVSEVPFASNLTGVILNDLANEFNPDSPNFGEKYAPPLAPVGFYDWNGNEVNRVYADQFGRYNAMVPSTFTANLPQPSGMSPNMLIACMNDAGPIPDPLNPGEMIVDPFFNPAFSQFCYTFQYMPGSATYLDTPVVAISAFTNPVTNPVDCELPHRTPMIRDVRNETRTLGPIAVAGDQIRIRSMGRQQVVNPEWDGDNSPPQFINRDYRFGAGLGTAELVDADGDRTALSIVSWTHTNIRATVPASTPTGDYQLVVTRVAGVNPPVESEIGVTLTVGDANAAAPHGVQGIRGNGAPYDIHTVGRQNSNDFQTIQSAIDSPLVAGGDMLLVRPGEYNELVILWKPVKLQGWGAGSVTINARQVPTEKISKWNEDVAARVLNGDISPLPGQNAGATPAFPAFGAGNFPTEAGAGIFVAGRSGGPNRFGATRNRGARIDGFNIVGASQGGGIVVNGYAPWMNIGNNRLSANAGFYGGGIRVGHPLLSFEDAGNNLLYTDAVNDRIRIHHNMVIKNGGMGGAGGGISLHTGADWYQVQENWVCGNLSQGHGAGIGHLGLSNNGSIEHNDVLFNESFSQANSVHGGGIFVGGQTPLQANAAGLLLSEGTGNVVIDANRIHGNMAGAGDGGGIAIVSVNGVDVADNPGTPGAWWDVSVFNNMITNNVTGLAGALSIQDSLEVHVQNNTIAHNDSTATVALAFTPGYLNQSNPLPAGVVSRLHTPAMATLLGSVTNIPVNGGAGRTEEYLSFSDASLNNNIVFANRSFYWGNFDNPNTSTIETGLFPLDCTTAPNCGNSVDAIAASYDLAVLDGQVDTGDELFVRYNLLTDTPENRATYTGGGDRFTFDPMFVNPLFNEGEDGVDLPEFTVLQTAGAFDEGGNFIQVAFAPLSIVERGSSPSQRVFYDYHIQVGSPAAFAGRNVNPNGRLGVDFDGVYYPDGDGVPVSDERCGGCGNSNDIGADEIAASDLP